MPLCNNQLKILTKNWNLLISQSTWKHCALISCEENSKKSGARSNSGALKFHLILKPRKWQNKNGNKSWNKLYSWDCARYMLTWKQKKRRKTSNCVKIWRKGWFKIWINHNTKYSHANKCKLLNSKFLFRDNEARKFPFKYLLAIVYFDMTKTLVDGLQILYTLLRQLEKNKETPAHQKDAS